MSARTRSGFLTVAFAIGGVGCAQPPDADTTSEVTTQALGSTFTASDDFGTMQVFSTTGTIDTANPFFQNLGANGRTCNSCHKLEDSLGLSGKRINSIFTASSGQDPLFRINDGSNAPPRFYSNTSTLSARQTSFSMLLNHGDIRVGEPVPSNADYMLAAVQDPYFFASAAELSLFRRPMPSVNMAFSTHVMWDGRESEGGRTAVRDALINHLNSRGIMAMIHYPTPVHLQEAYRFLGLGEGSYPRAERLASEIVTLPMYPELREGQARAVVEAVGEFFG